jgi:hypothetical protein
MSPALGTLLDSLIDYAGLFPPAQLSMADAVQAHATYLAGPHRAALGRFVLPASRLAEFTAAHQSLPAALRLGWRLNGLLGPEAAADHGLIQAFNARGPEAQIVAVEAKAATPAELRLMLASLPAKLEAWFEISPTNPDLDSLLAALKSAGHGAKLRTGGTTPEAFPSAPDVVVFIRACHKAGVVFKATAGLHHPLRGDFRLTYAPDAPRGRMFGFLNVALAAALIRTGATDADALAALEETDAHAFTLSPDALQWRAHRFTPAQLADTRARLFRSFGSCSFTEPLEGLQALSWL